MTPEETAAISDSRTVRNARPVRPRRISHAQIRRIPAIGHVVRYASCPVMTRVSGFPPPPPVKLEYFLASDASAIGIAKVASAR